MVQVSLEGYWYYSVGFIMPRQLIQKGDTRNGGWCSSRVADTPSEFSHTVSGAE